MSFKLSKSSKARLETTSPLIQKIIIAALESSMIDFGIPKYGGKRTAEEQKALYDDGKSKCDGKDKRSYHQSGNAVDIVAYVNGHYTYDARYYYMLGHHILSTAKRMGITNMRWGGDWDRDFDLDDQTFNDLCHFELN